MTTFPEAVFTRICHVKTFTDRKEHILSEFGRHGVPANFFLDHDVPDISTDMLHDFALPGGGMAAVSLALKHVSIWREFLNSTKEFCLVFEDDVFLASDFNRRLRDCIAEVGSADRKAVVYLGSGGNYYTPQSQLVSGRNLYPGKHARCTDAYLITRPAAEARYAWFQRNKLALPIDHQVDAIDPELGIEILWFERPIVEQGTHNGRFRSTIGDRGRPLWYKRLEWYSKKFRRLRKGHARS